MVTVEIFVLIAALVSVSYSRLFAAGSNDDGLLGIGKAATELGSSDKFLELSEEPFFSTSNIAKIGLGKDHVIVLTKYTGRDIPSLAVWGDNSFGQLGVVPAADSRNSSKPMHFNFGVILDEGDYIIDIAAGGSHNLLLTKNGRVFSYGNSSAGRLGIGTVSNTRQGCTGTFVRFCYSPQEVIISDLGSDDAVVSIKSYESRSFLITRKGIVYAFGDCSSFLCGLVDADGDSEVTISKPRVVSLLENKKIVDISMGRKVTIFVDDSRTGYSIGECLKGKLGVDTSVCVAYNGGKYVTKPTEIADLRGKIKDISTGGEHTVVLTDDGVYGFGYDNHGQLGIDNPDGTDLFFERPTKIPLTVFSKGVSPERIVAGESGTCVGATDGSVCCMGLSNKGELGFEPGKTVESCTKITVSSTVKYIKAMSMVDRNSFMVTSDERPETNNPLSGGAIAGIVIACIIVLAGIIVLTYFALKTKCWTNGRGKSVKKGSKRAYAKYSHIDDEKSSLIDRADNDEAEMLKGSII